MDDDGFDLILHDDTDGLALDEVDLEALKLERAIGLAETVRQVGYPPPSLDRIRAVLQERCDDGLVDLVLKLVAHYCPPTSSCRQ